MNADDIIPIDTGARHARVSVQDIRDDERLQTQRRMIAALYWRAGVARHLADVSTVRGQTGRYLQMHDTLVHAARAMEAACAR